MAIISRILRAGAAITLPLFVAACGIGDPNTVYPDKEAQKQTGNPYQKQDKLFGEEGIDLLNFARGDDGESGGGGSGIGVNAFLWRASLDTVSFMPIATADPFGGVIITDWYSPPETPNDRFKINIFILDRRLRADGIRATIFKQVRSGASGWQDVSVDDKTTTELEDAILTRARQLRIENAAG